MSWGDVDPNSVECETILKIFERIFCETKIIWLIILVIYDDAGISNYWKNYCELPFHVESEELETFQSSSTNFHACVLTDKIYQSGILRMYINKQLTNIEKLD